VSVGRPSSRVSGPNAPSADAFNPNTVICWFPLFPAMFRTGMTFRSTGAIPSTGLRTAARSEAICVAFDSANEKSWPLNAFETSSSTAPSRTYTS